MSSTSAHYDFGIGSCLFCSLLIVRLSSIAVSIPRASSPTAVEVWKHNYFSEIGYNCICDI